MASSPSIRWCTLGGAPLQGPLEWELAYLILDSPSAPWHTLEVTRNGLPLPVVQRWVAGTVQVVAEWEWPRSGPGGYQLRIAWPNGASGQDVYILPGKISPESFRTLLTDLQEQLPATVALGLKRTGGLVGLQIGDLRPATLAEELYRLKRAVLGQPDRPGLAEILPVLTRDPHGILEAHSISVRPERIRRPRPARLARALARPLDSGEQRWPAKLPDERVQHTHDVYENRLVQTCVNMVDRRLRHLLGLTKAHPDLAEQALDLRERLQRGRRGARFLDSVGELRAAPERLTMVLLKRWEYRGALEILLELQRALWVSLNDPRLLEPLDNLPALYQTWCTLQVVVNLCAQAQVHGYRLMHERLTRALPGSLLLQVLPDQLPLLVFEHPGTGRHVSLASERTFKRHPSKGPRSVSFPQRPDLVIEVKSPNGEVALWLLDPKYKLDSEVASSPEGDADEVPSGRPKKADIDKMHAYRDALRDEGGKRVVQYAAILYPGPTQPYGPGLAALSARPGQATTLHEDLTRELFPLFGQDTLKEQFADSPAAACE